jgi:ADP-heptose:LPS heptosyltransferase
MDPARLSWPDSPSLPDWRSLRRLLVVRLDNLGDVIMTSPALRAVKRQRPTVHLTLLASPGGAPAAALLPWVDEVFIWRAVWQDLGRLPPINPARELAFIDELHRRDFDAALILTSFSQSPHPVAFACALAEIPVRIGRSREHGRALTCELPRVPDELHQAERNLTLIEAVGVPVLDRSLEIRIPHQARLAARQRLVEHGVTGSYVLLNPWASCQARTFDPPRFAHAARLLAQAMDLRVVVCGGQRDRARASQVMEILGANGIDLVGATDLCTFAALIADARLVLTQNTAALHLADALAVPQLVMYSGTELESQWAPRASPHRLLRREIGCSPCYRFECPFQHACLDFTPEQVADAGLRLLGD